MQEVRFAIVIALDANVLLRTLLDDDPKQSRQAQAILARAAKLVQSQVA